MCGLVVGALSHEVVWILHGQLPVCSYRQCSRALPTLPHTDRPWRLWTRLRRGTVLFSPLRNLQRLLVYSV